MLVPTQDSGLLESKMCVSFIYLKPSTVPNREAVSQMCANNHASISNRL